MGVGGGGVYSFHIFCPYVSVRQALMAQSDAHWTGDQEVVGSVPTGSRNIFGEIVHEIFSCEPL